MGSLSDLLGSGLAGQAGQSLEGRQKQIDDAVDRAVNGDTTKDAKEEKDKANSQASPLILDLDGDGVETIGLEAGINFDHNANGFAETTGWAGKDDGFLVLDRNGNGVIDSGTELFGNNTVLANGNKAANGFEALKELDTNHDGKVDSADTAFSQLRVWKDLDSDGITDSGELLTLYQAGVKSLNTGYTNSTNVDTQGNAHKQLGSYTRTNGATAQVNDVWFSVDYAVTDDKNLLTISSEIAALPEARGYGNLHSLRQTLEREKLAGGNAIKNLLTQFTQTQDAVTRKSITTEIMYRWANAFDLSPTARGSYIDSRKLSFIEAFTGELYRNGSSVQGGFVA